MKIRITNIHKLDAKYCRKNYIIGCEGEFEVNGKHDDFTSGTFTPGTPMEPKGKRFGHDLFYGIRYEEV